MIRPSARGGHAARRTGGGARAARFRARGHLFSSTSFVRRQFGVSVVLWYSAQVVSGVRH